MEALSRRLGDQYINGNTTFVLDELAALPPLVAAYVGSYIAVAGVGELELHAADRWLRTVAIRVERDNG